MVKMKRLRIFEMSSVRTVRSVLYVTLCSYMKHENVSSLDFVWGLRTNSYDFVRDYFMGFKQLSDPIKLGIAPQDHYPHSPVSTIPLSNELVVILLAGI